MTNDAACWNKLDELEELWTLDILDDDIWELLHLEQLEFVLENYALLLGGADVWRDVLLRSAQDSGRDKFVVRGRLLDWTCTTGCASPGEIRFNLTRTFQPVSPADGHFNNNNIRGYNSARITIAHELSHILHKVLPAAVLSDYMNARGWLLRAPNPGTNNLVWLADNGATTVYDDPYHHLVHVTALNVAGGNTWDLLPVNARFAAGPIPVTDRRFVQGIGAYLR